jgi:hypothetical protein
VFSHAAQVKDCQQPRTFWMTEVGQTYSQKTVEVDAACVERAMEVIDCVLNRIVFSDKIDESVVRMRMIAYFQG